jgi:hypothetical protein
VVEGGGDVGVTGSMLRSRCRCDCTVRLFKFTIEGGTDLGNIRSTKEGLAGPNHKTIKRASIGRSSQ